MSRRLHPAQRGFTLIEVLVTLVLISVGLLGIAALQLTTIRGNQDSYVRSQANVLASDILDRMRANPVAFRSNLYSVDFNDTGDESTRAGQDLAEWQAEIDRSLPGGEDTAAGEIVRTPGANNRFIATVTIRWRERATGSGAEGDEGEDRTFSVRSEI